MNINRKIYIDNLKERYAEAINWAYNGLDIQLWYETTIFSEFKQNFKNKLNDTDLEFIKKKLIKNIKKYFLTYKKEELIIMLIDLKGWTASTIGNRDNKNIPPNYPEILDCCIYLLYIVISSKDDEFGNNSIIDGSKNLALAFKLMLELNILNSNIKHIKNHTILLEEIFTPNIYCDKFFNEYFESSLNNRNLEPPENYIENTSSEEIINAINNKEVIKYLNDNNLSIKQLQENINEIIGFSLNDLSIFYKTFVDNHDFLVNYDKDVILRKIKNISVESFNNIIKTFSISRIDLTQNENKILKELELKNIFEYKNFLIFCSYEMIFTTNYFEDMMYCEHFVDIYYKSEELNKTSKALGPISNRFSTYVSYCVLDKFISKGYIVPFNENSIPMAEIKSILNTNGINILNKSKDKTYGDIDVLAADIKKKIIYNIEIKCNKPMIDLCRIKPGKKEEQVNKMKKRLEKAIIREKILKENQETVLRFLNIDNLNNDNFEFKTIVISTKVDPFLKEATKLLNIEYEDWSNFICKIIKQEL